MDLFDKLKPEQEQEKRKLVVEDSLQKLLHGREAYKDVVFEKKVAYHKLLWVFELWKKCLPFDQSLVDARTRGYHRHPRPSESFSLLCAYYERTLPREVIPVAKSMKRSGEWLSLAVQRKGDYLHCYLDPENIVWGEEKLLYIVKGDKVLCTKEIPFYVGSQKEWVPARDLDPSLVEFLWSRPYAELPQQIKQRNLHLWIPQDDVIMPVGRDYFSRYDVLIDYAIWASRGVRTIAK